MCSLQCTSLTNSLSLSLYIYIYISWIAFHELHFLWQISWWDKCLRNVLYLNDKVVEHDVKPLCKQGHPVRPKNRLTESRTNLITIVKWDFPVWNIIYVTTIIKKCRYTHFSTSSRWLNVIQCPFTFVIVRFPFHSPWVAIFVLDYDMLK